MLGGGAQIYFPPGFEKDVDKATIVYFRDRSNKYLAKCWSNPDGNFQPLNDSF